MDSPIASQADCPARLVAIPRCYATSVILALRPWLPRNSSIWIGGIVADSKSGVSGAGKAPTAKTHFMYAADNLSAYGIFTHRHTGELLEQVGIEASQIVFAPHLLPIPRGILSTIYVHFRAAQTASSIARVYREFFAGSPMVRLYERALPQIHIRCEPTTPTSAFNWRGWPRAVIVSCLITC